MLKGIYFMGLSMMNEFTKEELLWLKHEVGVNIESFPNIHIACDIYRKLKSMIDNYCEHSESEPNHDYDVEQCNKCGKLFI